MKNFSRDFFIGCAVAMAAFGLYLNTLAPSVAWGDSGELAAAAATLGIAHPTGYPLYTLLGHAFSKLPLGHRAIWNLNLLSALLCAGAVFLFYRITLSLLVETFLRGADGKRSRREAEKKGAAGKRNPGLESPIKPAAPESAGMSLRIGAATGALILAFSETWWSTALSVEVYPLHLFLISLSTWFFLRALGEYARRPETGSNRWWYAFAFALGLGFSNHMTTGLLAPAFLYLFFATQGIGRPAWMKIMKAAPPFLAGLTPYLYLPLRAAHHPVMNWGNPASLEGFWRHVSGNQYRYMMFSSVQVADKQLNHFFSTFAAEFGYAPLVLALPGLAYLLLRNRKALAFSLLLFTSCVAYSVNYDILDIDVYFLPAYLVTAFWIACGARALLEPLENRAGRGAAWILCPALALFPLCLNRGAAAETGNYASEDYTRNVLSSVDSNAVIFTDQEQFFSMPAYYLQLAEGVRIDVAVLNFHFLSSPWYYAQLESRYPWLVRGCRAEIEAYITETRRYDRGEITRSEDLAAFHKRLVALRQSLMRFSYTTRPVYTTMEIRTEDFPGFQRVPAYLAFRLFRDTLPARLPPKDFAFRPLPKSTPDIDNIRHMYAAGYLNQAISLLAYGDTAVAISSLKKSIATEPDFQNAAVWLQRLQATR